jgi:predicted membrane channel-forming protein YqfA (hemolysin III family)
VVEFLLDPAIWDRLFRLLVLLVVGWLAVFVFRSISRKTGPFLEPLQTFLGWSVAVVGFVYAALIIAFAARVVSLIGWE